MSFSSNTPVLPVSPHRYCWYCQGAGVIPTLTPMDKSLSISWEIFIAPKKFCWGLRGVQPRTSTPEPDYVINFVVLSASVISRQKWNLKDKRWNVIVITYILWLFLSNSIFFSV